MPFDQVIFCGEKHYSMNNTGRYACMATVGVCLIAAFYGNHFFHKWKGCQKVILIPVLAGYLLYKLFISHA